MTSDRISGIQKKSAAFLTATIATLLLVLLLAAGNTLAADLDPTVTVDIAAGTPLQQALLDLAKKADMLVTSVTLAGYTAPALHATLPVSKAVDILLNASGLSGKIAGRTIFVSPANLTAAHPLEPSGLPSRDTPRTPTTGNKGRHRHRSADNSGDSERGMNEVTVEGHIPGSAITGLNITLTRADLEAGGFQTVGDALRALPQSFAGGLNIGVLSAGGSQNTVSQSAASSANLRGFGSASTLTLINGQRVATAEGSGAVDVTLIPISAVERIEITTSGASAIYGSDAVAGVVNIILRTEYQGVELSTALGTATEGGNFLQRYDLVAGHATDATNLFAAQDCAWQRAIDARQRPYVPSELTGTTLLPSTHRCSTLFSLSHDLPHDLEATVLGVYTKRFADQTQHFIEPSGGMPVATATHADVEQYALNTTVTAPFFDTWTAVFSASLSADNVDSQERFTANGPPNMPEGDRFDNRLWSVQTVATGKLIKTRAGAIQLLFGAGHHHADFRFDTIPASALSISKDRRTTFVFTETTIPILPPAPDVKDPALTLDLALRSERHSDVGTTTNPQVALQYRPAASIKLAASWGTSFRAPSLLQQYNSPQAFLQTLADPAVPGGQSVALLRFGGNPYLQPEESSDTTVDIAFTPVAWPGASLEISYYDIFYKKRIEYPTPNTGNPLSDPNVEPFVTRNPTAAEIDQILAESRFLDYTNGKGTPHQAALLVDDRNQNISRQRASGVDVLSKYGHDTTIGHLDGSLNIAYLDLRQRTIATSPSVPLSGMVFYPPNWRGRLGLSWSVRACLASLFINYTGSSREPTPLGPQNVASWTTLDGQIGFTIHGSGRWGTTKITLSAQNIFDRRPPLLYVSPTGSAVINYDSTNTSPVGRFVTLQVTVR